MNRQSATSPTGWWLAGLLQKQSNPDVAPYWNNYRLVKAKHWRTAFRRASRRGEEDAAPSSAFKFEQQFMGVTDLVPIYERLEDGAEILWEELWPEKRLKRKLPRKVYSERDLERVYAEPNTPSHRIAHPRRVRKR
jgi:hypothetical protein